MKGTTSECKKLLSQLQSNLSDEVLLRVKSLSTGNRLARWKGPFAWSILVLACSIELAKQQWGDVVWIACEVVNFQECQLTLKPLDFEKMLCNLANRFMDAKFPSWACALTSLLFERLKCLDRRASLSKICLGSEFLRLSPRLTYNPVIAPLLISCQILWTRLQAVHSTLLSSLLISETIFESGGIVETLGKLSDAKYIDLFLHHWRQLVCLLLSQKHDQSRSLLTIETKMMSILRTELPDEWRDKTCMIGWKNFCTYAAIDVSNETVGLVYDLQIYSLKKADEYLSRLEQLGAGDLLAISRNWKGCKITQWILMIMAFYKGARIDQSSLGPLQTRFSCSSSFEFWFSCIAAKCIGKCDSKVLVQVLTVLNLLEVIRHEATMKVIDGVLRNLVINTSVDVEFLKGAKRLTKLAVHFSKQGQVSTSIGGMAKVLATTGNTCMASQLIDMCATTLGEFVDNDAVMAAVPDVDISLLDRPVTQDNQTQDWAALLADSWCSVANKGVDSKKFDELTIPKHISILRKIIPLVSVRIRVDGQLDIIRRIIRASSNPEIRIECYFSLLGCANFRNVAISWRDQLSDFDNEWSLMSTLLCFLWDYVAKLDLYDSLDQLKFRVKASSTALISENVLHASLNLLQMQKEDELALDLIRISKCHHPSVHFTLMLKLSRFEEVVDYDGYNDVHRQQIAIDKGDYPHTSFNIDQLTPLYQSKAWYLHGKLGYSYQTAKKQFEQTLDSIKGVKVMTELWILYMNLMESIDWLLYLVDVISSYKLARYYVKAGLTYAETIRSAKWRQKMVLWLDHINKRSSIQLTSFEHTSEKVKPQCAPDIVDWIEQQICNTSYEQPPEPFRIYFSSNHDRIEDNEVQPFLNIVAKCGTTEQVRKVVCAELFGQSDPRIMLELIDLVYQRELLNWLETSPNESLHINYRFVVFIDPYRDLLYAYCKSPPFIDSPIMVRTKLRPSFRSIHEELMTLLDENRKMLFKPDALPTDDDAKRQWWINRHDLEMRLREIIRSMDQWMHGIVGFLPNLICGVGRQAFPLLQNVSRPMDMGLNLNLKDLVAAISKVPSKSIINAILASLGLTGNDSLNYQEFEDDPFVDSGSKSKPTKLPLLLSIDPLLHTFPWEACDSFKDYFLIRSFGPRIEPKELDVATVSAILNPSGDLKRTETFLSPLIHSLQPYPYILSRAPGREEMLESLSKDLFLYFGHGSGELYLSTTEISSLPPTVSSVMLFGCSSGQLKHHGSYKPEGILLAFRDADSPLIVSNLWDVTDRDIDKLTEAFLKDLDLDHRPTRISIAEMINFLDKSRRVCILRFLNGAAPVVYWNEKR